MGTVADKLALTESTKADIKAALQEKGQSPTDVFSTYGNLVRAIKTDPVLQSKTVTPSTSPQSVTPDSGYDGLDKVTVEAMPTAAQATPAISVDSAGKITAAATQSAGYVAAGTKSATKQMPTQAAKTVTPSTADQTAVAAGVYTTGEVKVAAIPDAYKDVSSVTAGAADVLAGKTIVDAEGATVEGSMANNGAVSQALNAGGSYTIPAGYHNGSGKVTANSLASQTDGDAAASDILSGKTAWVGGVKVTGDIATKTASDLTASGATVTVPAGYYGSQATKSVSAATQATPSISVSSAGLITASATQTAGYVSAGTKSATKQLTTKAATTWTPTTSNQTIASGTYLTGTQTIKGDANLVAANIKSGVSIFGVAGSYTGNPTFVQEDLADNTTVDLDTTNYVITITVKTKSAVKILCGLSIKVRGYDADDASGSWLFSLNTCVNSGGTGEGDVMCSVATPPTGVSTEVSVSDSTITIIADMGRSSYMMSSLRSVYSAYVIYV